MARTPSLCHTAYLCTTWIQIASATPETAADGWPHLFKGHGLIHSAPRSINILPSGPRPSNIILSQPPSTTEVPSSSPFFGLIPSASTPITAYSSVPVPTSYTGAFPFLNSTTPTTLVVSLTPGNASGTPVMQSTDQGLRPIPPAATSVGDPNGHHEIPEPNFTVTATCRGCEPIILNSASGWLDNSAAGEMEGTAPVPAGATITAGASNIIINQAPSGSGFVVAGSTTLTPGQTVTVGDTPIVVQVSAGGSEVVVGSTTIPLRPNPGMPEITDAPVPLPPTLTIGTKVITADPQTQYIVGDQTLSPGGPPITVSGTTLSLASSATALVINGATSSVVPPLGNIYTTEMPAAFSFQSDIYTVNQAGFIIIGPGTTLIPGGKPITVGGTILSFDESGTAVMIQGTSSLLQPVTTVVTLTKSIGFNGVGGGPSGHALAKPTGPPTSNGSMMNAGYSIADGWLGGCLLLLWWTSGVLAFGL